MIVLMVNHFFSIHLESFLCPFQDLSLLVEVFQLQTELEQQLRQLINELKIFPYDNLLNYNNHIDIIDKQSPGFFISKCISIVRIVEGISALKLISKENNLNDECVERYLFLGTLNLIGKSLTGQSVFFFMVTYLFLPRLRNIW